jgi:repressor LexA
MRKKTEGLTKKQKEVLDFIKRFHAENKYPPSIRQICSAIDLSSPATVHVHVNHLVEKGFIKRSKEGNRAMELLVPNEYEDNGRDVVNVPLLGKVTAGNPIEAIEIPNELFSLPSYLIPKKKEVFTLRVSGESMINVGIYDGDIIIVERQNTANNGDTIVAMTEDYGVTVKTFYKEKDHIRLQPENSTMDPIIVPDCQILGKVSGVFRKIRN